MTRARAADAPPLEERRVVRASGFVPVEAKLHVPAPRGELVLRGELIDRFRETLDCPVVLVTGPAGYGKTTVVRQWSAEETRPVAWLTLDEADNDPVTLLTYLMLALQRIAPVDPGVLGALSGGTAAVTTVAMPRLGRMLLGREPFLLILDEVDALTSPQALDLLNVLADNLPARCQVVLIARSAPDLSWSHLRAQRRLAEFDGGDLRLTRPEGRALLQGMALMLSDDDLGALLARTEGWAAGLYLAALSLRMSVNQREAIDAFTGDNNVVAGYLREELLQALPPQDQDFIIRASVLTRMYGPLCDEVLESKGSDATLQHLAAANVFVIPVDPEHHWFRFHRLFSDMLQSELHRREPDAVRGLHAHASEWWERADQPEDAIAHAIAAGDIDRAARLVWRQVPVCLATGRRATLDRWCAAFTKDQVVSHAKLALTAAWCAAEQGLPVEHWIAAAERGHFDETLPGEQEEITGAAAVLRTMLARDGVVAMGAHAELAEGMLRPEDPWRTLTMFLRGCSLHLTGRREEARALLLETEQLADALDVYSQRAVALAQLAVMAVEDNDWDRASELSDEASALLRDHNLEQVPTLAQVMCLATLVLAKRGLVDQAMRESRRAIRMVALTKQIAPWGDVQSRYLLARAHLLLGDSAAARVLLSEAQTHLRETADAVVLQEHIEALWMQIEQVPVAASPGWAMLTSAELRVLQYLPTHLSFEEIGKRLFVSRNTVKTQAIAAYRKLGVASRSEAVERAIALGMIEN